MIKSELDSMSSQQWNVMKLTETLCVAYINANDMKKVSFMAWTKSTTSMVYKSFYSLLIDIDYLDAISLWKAISYLR